MAVEANVGHFRGVPESPALPFSQKDTGKEIVPTPELAVEANQMFNDLRKILPKMASFQAAYRSTNSEALRDKSLDFDVQFDQRNYTVKAKFENKGKNGKPLRRLTVSFGFSLSGPEVDFDGKIIEDRGPFVKDFLSVSPDEPEIVYKWTVSDQPDHPQPDPNSCEALRRGKGFVSFMRGLLI